MKNLDRFKNEIYLLLFLAVTIALQSCIVNRPYATEPLKVPEIVQMSKDKVPSKDIIKEIKKTRTVYFLKADQLAKLRDEGVPDSVINYMEKTHIDAIAREQRNEDASYYWDPYWYGGLSWGFPYNYWGFGFGPSIVFENRSYYGHGGGYHGGGGHRH